MELEEVSSTYLDRWPRIDFDEITLLWHCAYWDGMLSGVCLYQGEKCYFTLVSEDISPEGEMSRDFILFKLTEEQARTHTERHELFRKYVGTHTDYDSEGKRSLGATHPQSEWHKYYDVEKTWRPITLGKEAVLGWFRW